MGGAARRHNPGSLWPVPEPFRSIYSHAVEVAAGSRLLFLSGQIGIASDGSLPPGFAAQCEQAMNNVEALLAAAGMTPADMAKVGYFLTRPEDQASLGEIRRRRWGSAEPPAVTTLVVAGLARPELLIEIEVAAAAP
ncbi:Enamine deaminase RidA, house cleaning of reactive enamine intermediates, YjgF/YER057c/UK114 family [Tistlia consotensis]|uniref:Enamine deaminase RidA, house cleaning of reactive enamine intermediates, YjgF/YER057c/UK114 family n=1 Tax=Tistlia consotensis USBA 355 TaxID=560819 RepID=A0A1Y6CM83_9PROT|nr:RidA family protein [Tistlia consotensis]SMF75621.1 Enamine deaminase RidA, house cleaning of reactive enamine intermediates, YjgF/YER057c/UK114 family [Tistlia consotensis USBA 355]SNS07645.1 Enamine deaminase RidA, house cleaning of reactive enamine intermediates, YjgF/YER057c/UK114 family [Tistlia consotensis]